VASNQSRIFHSTPAKGTLNVGPTFAVSVPRFAPPNKFYQCGPQPRSIARRMIVPMTEMKSDPKQPKRLEKKANIQAISRWRRQ